VSDRKFTHRLYQRGKEFATEKEVRILALFKAPGFSHTNDTRTCAADVKQ